MAGPGYPLGLLYRYRAWGRRAAGIPREARGGHPPPPGSVHGGATMQRLAAVLLTAVLSLAVLPYGPRTFGQDFPKPGPEHALLKDLEGTWDATVQGEAEPGKKMESKAVATYKLA